MAAHLNNRHRDTLERIFSQQKMTPDPALLDYLADPSVVLA